jgi:hypothetical protein
MPKLHFIQPLSTSTSSTTREREMERSAALSHAAFVAHRKRRQKQARPWPDPWRSEKLWHEQAPFDLWASFGVLDPSTMAYQQELLMTSSGSLGYQNWNILTPLLPYMQHDNQLYSAAPEVGPALTYTKYYPSIDPLNNFGSDVLGLDDTSAAQQQGHEYFSSGEVFLTNATPTLQTRSARPSCTSQNVAPQ